MGQISIYDWLTAGALWQLSSTRDVLRGFWGEVLTGIPHPQLVSMVARTTETSGELFAPINQPLNKC